MKHILFTADQRYAVRIPIVVKSIQSVHPGTAFHIHLISDDVSDELKQKLVSFCEQYQYEFSCYSVPDSLFRDAPVNKHYSKAMYYRMLAPQILPTHIDNVLYLDPDVLVINPLLPLWEVDMTECLFAAASHTVEEGVVNNINRLRLQTSSIYFNTGVLMMNLELCRNAVSSERIFEFIQKNGQKLLLPDQDVFNALFGERTLPLADEIWNYDARKYSQVFLRSSGRINERWILRNTAILHYCGREKPWKEGYRYRFGNLYRHYERLSEIDGWSLP